MESEGNHNRPGCIIPQPACPPPSMMIMRKNRANFRIWNLVSLILLVQKVNGFQFLISRGDSKCFKMEFPLSAEVNMEYNVIAVKGSLQVDLTINEETGLPGRKYSFVEKSLGHGTHYFVTSNEGEYLTTSGGRLYKFCLMDSNHESHNKAQYSQFYPAGVRKISVRFKTGKVFGKHRHDVATDRDIDPVKASLSLLESDISSMYQKVTEMKTRENDLIKSNNTVNSMLQIVGIISSVLILASAAAQIYVMQDTMKSKHIID